MRQQRRRGPVLAALIAIAALCIMGAYSYTFNQYGDVIIKSDGETFRCDRINCPKGSVRCQVIKSVDDSNASFMIRRNICFNRNGVVVAQNSSREHVRPGYAGQLNVVVSDDGYSTSSAVSSGGGQNFYGGEPIDGEALQQSIQQNVRRTLEQVDKDLERNLGGLWKGFNN